MTLAPMTNAAPQTAAPLRVFWQPGCSSCVKVKEYLAANGVDFVSVNILAEQGAMDELMALGIRSVPVLLQGERSTYAQSLDDVAKFVGLARDAKVLPPEVLIDRWLQFLRISRDLFGRLPVDQLETRPVPERARSNRQLGSHIFQIPESLLETVETGIKDSRDISNANYDHLRSKDDVLAYADSIIARLERWRASVDRSWFTSTVETYYGPQPAMHVLERGTWHSGQHARQLDLVVSTLTGTPAAIPPATYEGLPMPVGIWT